MVDIGGLGFGPDGRDVFEEGLYIPILKLAEGGTINETLLAMVRANSRAPIEVEGDIYSLAACNETGCERLVRDAGGVRSRRPRRAGRAHHRRSSREAMLERVRALPRGTYRNAMTLDGYEQPIELVARADDRRRRHPRRLRRHLAGHRASASTCRKTYCEAYTCFGLTCVIAPEVPNNAGSLGVFRVERAGRLHPERAQPSPGRDPPRDRPDAARRGVRLPATRRFPDRVPAEGTSCLWTLTMGRGATGAQANARRFMLNAVHNGGTGARPPADGLSATAYPFGRARHAGRDHRIDLASALSSARAAAGLAAVPDAPAGAIGQIIEIEALDVAPFGLWAAFDRIGHPPRGRAGGASGEPGRLMLDDGTPLAGKGYQEIPAGRRLIVHSPGGGGYGEPSERDPQAIAADRRDGLSNGLEPRA